jgi:hypothetical protein
VILGYSPEAGKGATGRKLPCPIQIRCEELRSAKISELVKRKIPNVSMRESAICGVGL